jgi:hypothetical protein
MSNKIFTGIMKFNGSHFANFYGNKKSTSDIKTVYKKGFKSMRNQIKYGLIKQSEIK